MKTQDLIKALDTLDKQGIWAFKYSSLKLRFQQSDRALLKSLSAHQKNGYVLKVAKGLYVNPRARSLPADILPALVPWLRPFEMNYVSLESALSDYGRISQVPGRLTVMSTGKSWLQRTPYGDIEFVHTRRNPANLQEQLLETPVAGLYRAPETVAVRDLKRVGRNTGLLQDRGGDP